jgi:hypothetical protein
VATALLAGAAAVVRQYFAEGWYPLGRPTPALALNASAALVKAMLVGSAWSVAEDSMAFWEGGGRGRRVAPDGAEGFGRPNLHRALYVAPAAHEPGAARLYVVDETFGLAATGHAPRARAPCRTRAAAPVPTRRRADARAAGEGRWVHEYRFLADMSVDEPEVARPPPRAPRPPRAPLSARPWSPCPPVWPRVAGERAGVTRHARGRRSR